MRRASGRAGLLRWGAVALYAGIAASLAPPARAAEAADAAGPTFTRDVAPIVHRRCAECHRPGDVAPMSLLTYDEARPWAKAIQKAVVSREMPPWDADPAVGRWSNDISLAKEEIETIVAWVDAGAPQGDPAELPLLPTWSRGWRLGEPDAILELPSFDVPAQGADRFPSIFVELGNQERKYVRAVELHIGERSVLHHMVLFQGPLAMTQDIVDLRSPENRRGRLADTPKLLYVWAAGSPPVEFPEGIGHVLEPNQVLTLNMHYHPGGAAAKDASSLGLYFTDEPPRKELQTAVAIKSSLRVPAGSRDAEDTAWFLFPQDSLMLSFLPHMHQRGAAIRYTLHYPDGTDEVVLDVPRYDYDWQWIYQLKEPKRVPAGTLVEVVGRWDNSADNPRNPNPGVDLAFGEGTDDEMLVGFVDYVVQEGVRPAPYGVSAELRRILDLRHASADSFVAGAGMMAFGLHLPRSGGGALYMLQGNVLIAADFHDVVWEGDTAYVNSEMLTSSADTMPLGLIVTRPAAGGVEGEMYFGRKVSVAERAALAGSGQSFRGAAVDAGVSAGGR